jgi:hypothetical protein
MHEPIRVTSQPDGLQIKVLLYLVPVALVGAGIQFKHNFIGVVIASVVFYAIVGFAYLSGMRAIKFFSGQAKRINDENTGDAYLCGMTSSKLVFRAVSADAAGITIWQKSKGTITAQTTIPYSGVTIEKGSIAMNGLKSQEYDGIIIKSQQVVTNIFIYPQNCRPWAKPAQGIEIDQIVARWLQYAQSA